MNTLRAPRPAWVYAGGAFLSALLAFSPCGRCVVHAAEVASTVSKSETVHVVTDATGTVMGVTVQDVLLNADSRDTLVDRSKLAGIVPDEEGLTYTKGENDALTWSTGGGDVSYEGTSTDSPPVNVRASYTLDGTTIAPQMLAGATGHLVMRIDYENRLSELRLINGKETRIYTPFVCLTVAILDADVFRNVSVENGKVVDDKGGLAVVGYALPGLRESLGLNENGFDLDLDLPEYVQIEADVQDLTLDPLYTIVTPELFGEIDASQLDLGDLDELEDGADALRDATDVLVDGESALRDALYQIVDGSAQIGGGARALREALDPLPEGMAQLRSGAQELSDRLEEASGAVGGLTRGAAAMAEASDGTRRLVGAARGEVETATSLVTDVRGHVDGAAYGDARAALGEARDAATSARDAVTTARDLYEGAAYQVTGHRDVAASSIALAQDTLAGFLDDEEVTLTEEQRAVLENVRDQLASADDAVSAIDPTLPVEFGEQVATLDDAASRLRGDVERFGAGVDGFGTIVDDADGALEALGGAAEATSAAEGALGDMAQGARDLAAGSSGCEEGLLAASDGAQALADGMASVSDAAPQALAGIDALAAGSDQLTDVLAMTADGSDQLVLGMTKYRDEGISKVADVFGDLRSDLGGMRDRLDALRAAAKAYDSFAGKAEGQSGTVRFVYKTERIG